MNRLDYYKFFTMSMIFILEFLTLSICALVSELGVVFLLAVLFLELIRFICSLHTIELVERDGEVIPLIEKADKAILWFNSFLVCIAVIVAVIYHIS